MINFIPSDAAQLPVLSTQRIYLDYNGSTPTHPDAIRAMMPFLTTGYGNPSSGHWASKSAKDIIETARESVARLINADPSEIIFTSGASEANNLAIKGLISPKHLAGRHVITSAIEHEAVSKPIRALRAHGVKVTTVPVDEHGRVDPTSVEKAITDKTALVSIMMANNEVGTIQPIAEIAKLTKKHGIAFHTDAAQAIGKIPVDVGAIGVDMLSIAGHKFGAPNGIGALYVRRSLNLTPLIHGAGHEGGRRAGTESALLAAGLGAAADAAISTDKTKIRNLRDYFWAELQAHFGDKVVLNGHPTQRVANTLNISFPGHVGAEVLAKMPHVAATTGSACHAGCVDMSHVLIAMGKSLENGLGAIRFSLGENNTRSQVNSVVATLRKALN